MIDLFVLRLPRSNILLTLNCLVISGSSSVCFRLSLGNGAPWSFRSIAKKNCKKEMTLFMSFVLKGRRAQKTCIKQMGSLSNFHCSGCFITEGIYYFSSMIRSCYISSIICIRIKLKRSMATLISSCLNNIFYFTGSLFCCWETGNFSLMENLLFTIGRTEHHWKFIRAQQVSLEEHGY